MDRLWPRLLARPTNLLRLAALLGFALLAGLALVVSLTTRNYSAHSFRESMQEGWADLRALVSSDGFELPQQLRDTPLVALAPLYPISDSITLGYQDLRLNRPGPELRISVYGGMRPAVMVAFEPHAARSLPRFLVGPDAPTAPLRPGEAWVTRDWARRHQIKKGDTINLTLLHAPQEPPVTLLVTGIGEPVPYLFIHEDIFAYPIPASLPAPAPNAPLLLLASVGPARFAEIARALEPAVTSPESEWNVGLTTSFVTHSRGNLDSEIIGPYEMIALLSKAASSFMGLLACFAAACSLWLAASLYLDGRELVWLRTAHIRLGAQMMLLYWTGTILGVLLGGYGPNMLSWEALGLGTPQMVDSALMRQAFVVLAALAPPALPAIVWLRSGESIKLLRRSRWGNQLRAGLIGSVVLVTALGLALYSAGWLRTQSLLFYNVLAATVTGVIGGVGPAAVLWNRDQTYRAAARSAGTALFVCLLMAFTFCTLGALLIFWTLWPLRELPVLTALGITLAGIIVGYLGAIIFGLVLSLTAGTMSGILVVAFGRRISATERETLAENAVRIEGLLLLSRFVLSIMLSIFIFPASRSPSLRTTLDLYLVIVLILIILLRLRPQRVLIWSAIASLVDAATISTLVAADGGLESPFFLLYFVALLTVAMRFGSIASLGASVEYCILYIVALISVEGWTGINGERAIQGDILNRVLLLLVAGLLASLLAGERQRVLRRLEAANKQLLADEVIRHELELARQIQQNLFPRTLPLLPGIRIAARCLPARETGGDFFDIQTICEGQLAVVVGDVSGKSVPAAMVMAMARSAFRSEIIEGCGPARALSKANLTLQGAGRGIFVASQYALIDPERHTLTLGNAGQMAPMLRRGDEVRLLQIAQPALPLGITTIGSYHEQTYDLQPGDLLLFYTDGVIEAMNSQKELYGFERLEIALRYSAGLSPEALIDRLISDIISFSGNSEQHDDITLVAIEIGSA